MTAIFSPQIPVLRHGDQMSREEFERRYKAMPDNARAELIGGMVCVTPPVTHRGHAAPHVELTTWLGTYWAATPGVSCGDNGTLRLDLGNSPQPDAYLLILPEHGGQARIDEDDYVVGAPELVAEVARSSVSFDLHGKLEAYRRNGAVEYIVRRPSEKALDWFVLRYGSYEMLVPSADGMLRSDVFPGLWLDHGAFVEGDLAAVLRGVQAGVASAEHAAFVERLRAARV